MAEDSQGTEMIQDALNLTCNRNNAEELGVNVTGLISIVVFYLAVLVIGLWAGWKQRKLTRDQQPDQETVMLAGRNIGLFVGVLTMGGKKNDNFKL